METTLAPITPPSPEEGKRKARLTLVQQVYHNVPEEKTNGPEPLRFFRWLESDDIAYERTIKVEEEWIALDLGWLKDKGCSYLFLENCSVRPLGKIATQEESDEWAAKVIEFGLHLDMLDKGWMTVPIGYLSPEEGTGFSPIAVETLRVRCRKGQGKLTYFIVPK